MIVILTCWGKLTRRKSPIVIEVPKSVKAEPNAQLLFLDKSRDRCRSTCKVRQS